MRNLLAVAALLATSTLAVGCSCGAFSGGGDAVYSRNQDSLIICENGGFVANVPGGAIEGRYTAAANGDGGTAVRGDNGQVAFTLTSNADGTVSTTGLGDGTWNHMELSTTDLDHADIQCSDLLSRAWWAQ